MRWLGEDCARVGLASSRVGLGSGVTLWAQFLCLLVIGSADTAHVGSVESFGPRGMGSGSVKLAQMQQKIRIFFNKFIYFSVEREIESLFWNIFYL